MSSWFERLLARDSGFERDVVEHYTRRLLDLARRKLPRPVQHRVDPQDVVQSVYRSFFQRLQDGRFSFEDSHDVWQLLATMTFRKASNASKFHLRARRDVRRDRLLTSDSEGAGPELAVPDDEDIDLLWECLDKLVEGLPETHRAIVVLRLQGEPIAEIARQVGRSRRTVLRVLENLVASGTALGEG